MPYNKTSDHTHTNHKTHKQTDRQTDGQTYKTSSALCTNITSNNNTRIKTAKSTTTSIKKQTNTTRIPTIQQQLATIYKNDKNKENDVRIVTTCESAKMGASELPHC